MIRLLYTVSFLLLLFSCKKEEEHKQPFVDFTYSGNKSVAPITVNFIATPSEQGTVEWDFGDGEVASGTNVTHVYDSTGFYPVSCRISTDYGIASKLKYVNASSVGLLKIISITGSASTNNPAGLTWDATGADSNPDLYFKVFTAANTEFSFSGGYIYYNNVFNATYSYMPALTITDFEGAFKVKFLDYDLSPDEDDVVGEYSFRPGDYFTSTGIFPGTFTKTDANTGSAITVSVVWAN